MTKKPESASPTPGAKCAAIEAQNESLALGAFASRFGEAATWIASAPGRVNLMGDHVDYNDGRVLPMALQQRTTICAAQAPSSPRCAEFYSVSLDQTCRIDLPVSHPAGPQWSRYLQGVLAEFEQRGTDVPSFRAVISSDVPIGGGLSSSAALEVALASLLEIIGGVQLEPWDRVHLCRRAERTYAGVPCGIMDQFTAVFAQANHLLCLDCQSLAFRRVPFNDAKVSLLMLDSQKQHALASSGYRERSEQCRQAAAALGADSLRQVSMDGLSEIRPRLDKVLFSRVRHVVSETQRVEAMASAVAAGQWERAGELMFESHRSLRDDFEVSCAEIDFLVATAQSCPGVFGARLTGGGFGGCAIVLLKTDAMESVSAQLANAYHRDFEMIPVQIIARSGGGARARAV